MAKEILCGFGVDVDAVTGWPKANAMVRMSSAERSASWLPADAEAGHDHGAHRHSSRHDEGPPAGGAEAPPAAG